ncbi:Protein K10C2.1 [Aphelenchoides avenae]|nr:Protein K10C2.1 [Aphelenchus avenae]
MLKGRYVVKQARTPWKYALPGVTNADDFQVAGFQKSFDFGGKLSIDLLTVKGSGHFVPTDRPGPALQMVTNFFAAAGNFSKPLSLSLSRAPLKRQYQPLPLAPPEPATNTTTTLSTSTTTATTTTVTTTASTATKPTGTTATTTATAGTASTSGATAATASTSAQSGADATTTLPTDVTTTKGSAMANTSLCTSLVGLFIALFVYGSRW